MAARFELGDPEHPRGHALVYFRVSGGGDELLATYVVVLPIAINPAKYIPPASAGDLAALRRLAEHRGDDLLDGGVVESDPERLMVATHEASRDYAARYETAARVLTVAP